MVFVLALSIFLLILGLIENAYHAKNLLAIPLRIHVNGTRGKSTTTRLIAGGLRAGGFRVLAKTTGTAARLIVEDGSELPVRRWGRVRIIEQRKVVAEAARRGVEVLVVECMAVHPEMQWVAEHRLIRSHIGVITNVREDHLDEMGPTLQDIANTLALTIPVGGTLVTHEEAYAAELEKIARTLRTKVVKASSEMIKDEDMQGFSYLTFKENVAVALSVCELMGVQREAALRGMWEALPDPGVMKVFKLQIGKRKIYLVNALAANDLASTLQTYDKCLNWQNFWVLHELPVIGVCNNRADRSFRARELSRLVHGVRFSAIYLIGQLGFMARHYLQCEGFTAVKDWTGRLKAQEMLAEISCSLDEDCVLLAYGNIKGAGEVLVNYFEQNGEEFR